MVFGFYYFNNKKTTNTESNIPWYKEFNPFYNSENNNTEINNSDITENNIGLLDQTRGSASKFYQLTDFSIAGATYFEDIKQTTEELSTNNLIKTEIDPSTKEGRKEIQNILNNNLSLMPKLTVDGNFGKLTISAIKEFQKIKNIPVTGVIDNETAPFFYKITESTEKNKINYQTIPSIKYVERINGHIHQKNLKDNTDIKTSNSTIPTIYEALFDSTTKTVIYRYLSSNQSIMSFLATMGAKSGEFLPNNISEITLSPDKTKIFYLTDNSNGVSGTIKSLNENRTTNIFNSSFTEWLPQWVSNDKIFLTTKPSYVASGNLYSLDTNNKKLTKILGGINGLTTLSSPDGSIVLYSSYSSRGPLLGLFDINKNTNKSLNIYGLTDKCFWSNDNINIYCAIPNSITGDQYPDYWYQGLVSFDDYFVKINTLTGEKVTLANSIDEKSIDGINLFLDKSESILFFTNKKNYTLWGLSLE